MARIIIFGAGAVGSVLGARLSGSHSVLLIGRQAHVDAVRRNGLRIEGSEPGTFEVDANDSLTVGQPADSIVVAVKSFDLGSAGREIGAAIRDPVPILAIQNGLGIEGLLAGALEQGGWKSSERWIVRGVISIPATLLRPGVVRQAGQGEVVVGAPRQDVPASLVDDFVSALSRAHVPTQRSRNLAHDVWMKVIVNAGINPVTADHGAPNGELSHEPLRGQALRLVREAAGVARADGVQISDEEAEQETMRVVRATRENVSSMLQDIRRGRPTEIDSISGEILARGRLHQLNLPFTERAWSRIRQRAAHGLHSSTERP